MISEKSTQKIFDTLVSDSDISQDDFNSIMFFVRLISSNKWRSRQFKSKWGRIDEI